MHTCETLAAFRSGLYPSPNRNVSRGFPTLFRKTLILSPTNFRLYESYVMSRTQNASMTVTAPTFNRPISRSVILLLVLAVHGPLLLMQLPAASFDTNLHIFFASHYAHHWFNPWNEKWFAGFSQTTYPPLTHQWIALLSNIVGLNIAYMLVQLAVLFLLAIGVYRFAKLWVDERSASYAAIGSIVLGVVAFMVYQAGQLATVTSAALYRN